MKRFKKLLLGLVAFAAMAVLCAVCAGAETYGDYEYEVLDDGTVEIAYYYGYDTAIEIPATIDGKSVTSIGNSAFGWCDSLASITIPDSVTSIGDFAFTYCTSLERITLPDGVTSIGVYAFESCQALSSVIIPDSVETIASMAFVDCTALKSVTIPESVTSIGDCAFGYYLELIEETEDSATHSVEQLSDFEIIFTINSEGHRYAYENGFTNEVYPFEGPEEPEEPEESVDPYEPDDPDTPTFSITFDLNTGDTVGEPVEYFTQVPGTNVGVYECTILDDGTISVKIWEWWGNSRRAGGITVPSKICGYTVTQIASDDRGCGFSSITLPDTVTTLSESAFAFYCYLEEINFGANPQLKTIERWAFQDCRSLKSITIPASVETIGYGAFLNSNNNDFGDLTDVYSLETVKFAKGSQLKTIGEYAFNRQYALKSVELPEGLVEICGGAFDLCTALEEITIPASVEIIGSLDTYSGAFIDCPSLTIVTFAENSALKTIGNFVFSGTPALKAITIPASVEEIGICVFSGSGLNPDSVLTAINVDENNKSFVSVDGVVYSKDKTKIVAYPGGRTAKLVIPETVTELAMGLFNRTKITSVSIPSSITEIPEAAFEYCSELKEVTLAEGLKIIGEDAFEDCTSLKSITIPKSVTSIDDSAFSGCENLKIYCYSGTAAETYAKENEFNYVLIDTPPTVVTGLKLGGRASNALRLNWTKNSSADGYIIEQYKSGKWVRIAKITSNATTTYRASGLVAGTGYKFRIKSYRMDGSTALYSGYTSTLSARTNPSNVSGLKLGGRASNALRLNWNKNTSASGYIIEQYKSGKWVRIAKISSNATTTYRVSGLSAGTAYKFRMKAYKMSGSTALYSAYTSTLSARTNPSNVTGVKIGGKASNALRVNWTKNTSSDGYIIEIYKSGKWVRAAKITKNTTVTYRISGLAKNTTYKIRIKAYKMSGSTALYSGYTTISGKTTA